MKKTNRKNKKRLSALLLMLFLTVVMLSTATFAWFTSNRTVTINDITVNVSTSSGLQISTDANNWKTRIENSDIITGYNDGTSVDVNQLPSTLAPVSTAAATDSSTGFMKMFLGDVQANETTGIFELTAVSEVETKSSGTTSTGHFVAFDVFLKAETGGDVYLTQSSGVTDDSDAKGLKNAARIAFITEGSTAVSSTVSTMLAMHSASAVTIWEPNADAHTQSGINNAVSYYSGITGVSGLSVGTGNTTLTYDGVADAITSAIPLADTNASKYNKLFAPVTTTATPETRTSSFKLLTLNPGVTKLRIYFWVEGQDVDCENEASGHDIVLNLSFSLDA